jgi:hypothetical protein
MYLKQQNREATHTIPINSKATNPAHLSIRHLRRRQAMPAVYHRVADIQIAGRNNKDKKNSHKKAQKSQKKKHALYLFEPLVPFRGHQPFPPQL